jgi:hypothetical protein
VFRLADGEASERCLDLARRALQAGRARWPVETADTLSLCYAVLAGCEMFRATGRAEDGDFAQAATKVLLHRQETGWTAGQRRYRGFFYDGADKQEVFKQVWQSGVLPYALLTADECLRAEAGRRAERAFGLYADEFLLPLSVLSPFGVLPYGVFLRPPTHDVYRPLAGGLTYRFFYPVRTPLDQPDAEAHWWLGPTAHVLGHAAALLAGGRRFHRPEYRDLALRQLEWVHGSNPLGANAVNGRGLTCVWPHSRYVGIIPGAVTNGVNGTPDDQPVFASEHLQWQTTEYWSPHQAACLMCLCELHERYDLSTDIGVAAEAAPSIGP